jgi:hypothetical protein
MQAIRIAQRKIEYLPLQVGHPNINYYSATPTQPLTLTNVVMNNGVSSGNLMSGVISPPLGWSLEVLHGNLQRGKGVELKQADLRQQVNS